MPRPLHEEGGIPSEQCFTTADVRWACQCAGRVRRNEEREAEFLIAFAEAVGKSLEDMAVDCEMTAHGYRYLRRECAGDFKAMVGLNSIRAFRGRVAEMVRLEARNRRSSSGNLTAGL